MRKPDKNQMLWALRRQKLNRKKQIRLAGRRKSVDSHAHKKASLLSVVSIPTLLMAEHSTQREKIHKAINVIQSALNTPRRKVRLDFSKTKKIYPGGMLLLLAHLQLFLDRHPRRISARCPPHSRAAQLLRHFGFADRLGIPLRGSKPTHDSVIHWRYAFGTRVEGEEIANIINGYRQSTRAEIPDGLYDTLTEALTNVRHHAYDHTWPEHTQRWWVFARYDEPKNSTPGDLYIAVYDMGLGIQTTMHKKLRSGEIFLAKADALLKRTKWQWRSAQRKLAQLLLLNAIEHTRSSTDKKNRGRGLPEMRDFVLQTNHGKLDIISGQAEYHCSPLQNPKSSRCTPTNDQMVGTLILWSIPLQFKEAQ